MASSGVIAELLRLDEEEKRRSENAPYQQQQQIMQGILQGLQLYDAVKSIPLKYGTKGTPGKKAVTPSIVDQPNVFQKMGFGGVQKADTPGQLPPEILQGLLSQGQSTLGGQPIPGFIGPQNVPAATITPGSPGTVPTYFKSGQQAVQGRSAQPGLYQLQSMAEAAKVSPDLAKAVGSGFGVNVGRTTQQLRLDEMLQAIGMRGAIQEHIAGMKMEEKDKELQLMREKLNQSHEQFMMKYSQVQDQNERGRMLKMEAPAIKVLSDPKFADDKTAIQFATDYIDAIEQTGNVPDIQYKRGKLLGIIPTEKKAVVPRGDNKKVERAKQYIKDQGWPETQANIDYVTSQLEE